MGELAHRQSFWKLVKWKTTQRNKEKKNSNNIWIRMKWEAQKASNRNYSSTKLRKFGGGVGGRRKRIFKIQWLKIENWLKVWVNRLRKLSKIANRINKTILTLRIKGKLQDTKEKKDNFKINQLVKKNQLTKKFQNGPTRKK